MFVHGGSCEVSQRRSWSSEDNFVESGLSTDTWVLGTKPDLQAHIAYAFTHWAIIFATLEKIIF